MVNKKSSLQVLELSGFDVTKDFGICLPLYNVDQMDKPVALLKKSLADFVGLKECLTLCCLKSPVEFCPSGSHEKGSVPLFKKSGRTKISPERYMNVMETFQPDFYTTLADGDTFMNCPKKRVIKSCERSEEFFSYCVGRHATSTTLKSSSAMIASVEGAYNEFERKRLITQMKDHEGDINGYFIDGLHRNGAEATTVDPLAVTDIVKQTLAMLPTEKLKFMLGAYLPHHLLDLVSCGVDVFDTSLVNLATNCNRALVFNFDIANPVRASPPEIDLKDAKFKEDFSPFLDGCQCKACRSHTRAYTNHLLLTRELLGPTLLSIHNLYHYKTFFEAIRDAIKADKLPQLIELVSAQYKDSKLVYQIEEPTEKTNKENKDA